LCVTRTVESLGGTIGKSQLCWAMRALIADGQKDVGISLAALVERCGHEVLLVVGSGLEAIQAYSRLKPDVVILDYPLPRLNGVTAARMILAKDPAARIIIVATPSLVKSPIDSVAFAILAKPVELDKLYAALYDAGSGKSGPPNARH
jgi:two-component system chemotaxis response regulator CheY